MTIQDTITTKTTRRERLAALYQLIAPTWPLAGAVACNPLQGLEPLPFAEAVREGQRLFDASCLPGLWQLRQARLAAPDVQEALDRALAAAPSLPALGGVDLDKRRLATAMLETMDDAGDPSADSPLLERALPHLPDRRSLPAQSAAVNQECITWLSVFLDEGQAAWEMPFRELGFFAALRRLLLHDPAWADRRALLQALPADSLAAIDFLLAECAVSPRAEAAFLRDHLLALPGWASFIRWRSEQSDYSPQQAHPINLTDYLAVRLLFACLFADRAQPAYTASRELKRLNAWAESYLAPPADCDGASWAAVLRPLQEVYFTLRLVLLQRWEAQFRRQLTDQLGRAAAGSAAPARRYEAQLAFCIDVRSEPFRRQVEAVGEYETFGFAGFFGLPIAYETILGKRVKSLPVLLQPAHELRERAGAGCDHQLERYRRGRRLLNELKAAYKSLKYNLATPFAAVEALGLPAGLITVGRSLIPRALIRLRRQGLRLFYPSIDLAPDIDLQGDWGIPLDNQVGYAGNALRMMGLTQNFAPLIVLCGHGSQTENNPYAAALDCGACGGSHGGPNAAAMARILNQPAVRERLREQGIDIPEDTLFVGGEHNTTTDEVRLLDLGSPPPEKQQQIAALQAALKKAQHRNLALRASLLGEKKGAGLLRRSTDWSEVRPEWGLAGNAGFVAAPRRLTEDLDLRGRCFLHSYDWRQDPDSTSLETILTAPLVVAQWINSQYFFSTVDNVAFGSGSKITHNVVGKVGIMQGNGSDLMHGLPLQSVMKNDRELYHQPLRLTAMVAAPRDRVQRLVEKHAILQQMFFNEWVSLIVMDPEQDRLFQLLPDGEWEEVERR